MKRTTNMFRTLIAGGSALALVITLAPLATASGLQAKHADKSQISVPKIPGLGDGFLGRVRSLEVMGNGLEGRADALAKKQVAKNGSASPALVAAIVAYKTARDNAIAAFTASTKSAQDAYKVAVAPAALTLKTALDAAKTAFQNATHTREAAKDAYKVALKTANDTFQAAIKTAKDTYKAAL